MQSGGRDGYIYIRDARTSAGQRGDVSSRHAVSRGRVTQIVATLS